MDIFRDHADRRYYLELIAEHGAAYGLRFLAWCLMTDHVHLIVVPEEEHAFVKALEHRTWRVLVPGTPGPHKGLGRVRRRRRR